ncbi:MAG: IS1634 family transposase [Magnetococcales bacterium]|nr:IS1634 family transposase [Magnetococcales bacterium]
MQSIRLQLCSSTPSAVVRKLVSKLLIFGYAVKVAWSRHDAAIDAELRSKGRFVLATNQLDHDELSDLEFFQEYKDQSQVEGGFRFLKDPWFMVDSIFLKTPKRIEALMMIMTLCLMVYNVGQYQLREKLSAQGGFLPNQVGKQVQNPTLRWVFRVMEGITIARVMLGGTINETVQEIVCNVDDLHEKIIRYFGKHAMSIYGVT